MKIHKITLPLEDECQLAELEAGDQVLISGTIYAARDAVHKRIFRALELGEKIPMELAGQGIYYVGPCPAPPGKVIGSAGPTTSGRMDPYTPLLIEKGLKIMVGKGDRNQMVVAAMKRHGAVYLAAPGGAGAYLSQYIKKAEIIAYPDLGPEALVKMEVEALPCLVAIDTRGHNVYHQYDKKGTEKLEVNVWNSETTAD